MLTTALYAIVALVAVALLSDLSFTFQDVTGEPRRAKSPIPLIGHLVGLIRFGTVYFSKIG